jgi:hypothetical protein
MAAEGGVVIPAWVYAVVIAAGVGAGGGVRPDAADLATPAARCEALTAGLHIAPTLRPVVADMCRRAPTFRRQVARIAQEAGLVVRVEPGRFPGVGRVRAATEITKVDGRLRSADVRVRDGDSILVVELVAHEFEHILEQLDGVDLAKWAGHSGVYRVGGDDLSGPIETERARQVGRLVAGEYAASGVETTALRVP